MNILKLAGKVIAYALFMWLSGMAALGGALLVADESTKAVYWVGGIGMLLGLMFLMYFFPLFTTNHRVRDV